MKSLCISLFIVALLTIGVGIEKIQAQCIACYHSAGGCNTEEVERNGSAGCVCDTGCRCSGECEYEEEEDPEAFVPGMDLNELNISDEGYKIKIKDVFLDHIYANFDKGGKIGDTSVGEAWFGDAVALYELSGDEFLIFPLKEDQFDLKSCDGEVMATIKRN